MQRKIFAIRRLVFDICPLARRLANGVVFVVGGLSCARISGHALTIGTNDDAQPFARQASSSRGRAILPAEILAASRNSAYDAVVKLRPGFFSNSRFTASGREAVVPSVILEKGPIEPLDILRFVSVDVVREIEFIEPDDARTRYGSAYSAGIVVVRLTATLPSLG
jgi:hypothetical protein